MPVVASGCEACLVRRSGVGIYTLLLRLTEQVGLGAPLRCTMMAASSRLDGPGGAQGRRDILGGCGHLGSTGWWQNAQRWRAPVPASPGVATYE